jgi:hypothetical protein
MRAVDEIARVLAPGGRVALLSSCNRGSVPTAITSPLVKSLTGVRVFGRDELTRALTARGLIDVRQRVSGAVRGRAQASDLMLPTSPHNALGTLSSRRLAADAPAQTDPRPAAAQTRIKTPPWTAPSTRTHKWAPCLKAFAER